VTDRKPQIVAWHPEIEGEHRAMLEGRLAVIQRMVRVRREEGIPLGETIFLVADPSSNVGQLLAKVLGLEGENESAQPLVGAQARAFVDAVCPLETMQVLEGRPEGAAASVTQGAELEDVPAEPHRLWSATSCRCTMCGSARCLPAS
jgi:hypothetical protein